MKKLFCAGNSRGFSESVRAGGLPDVSHISFEGVFNELKFDAGQQTDKPADLKFGYARYQFPHSAVDPSINDFLVLLLKGERDGKDRDHRRLNSIICLDISGSMGGPLSAVQEKQRRTRLELSVEAMRMFVSKLRPDDAVGIVVFDTEAETILPVTMKKDLTQGLYEELAKIRTRGGTTIRRGFERSLQEMTGWLKEHGGGDCENRIIMITDVGDSSFAQEGPTIEGAAKEGVNLTIVGVSSEFQSRICEGLKHIRGFNYFCAINDDDIKKYVFEEFDFSFFPAAHNEQIAIACDSLHSFEVFGVPDADKTAEYNHGFAQPAEQLIVSRVKSSFPSGIEVHGDKVLVEGGLILLKLKPTAKTGKFDAVVTLSYDDLQGQRHFQEYPISYEFHKDEQFFSEPALREAIEGFIFVSEVRALLRDSRAA